MCSHCSIISIRLEYVWCRVSRILDKINGVKNSSVLESQNIQASILCTSMCWSSQLCLTNIESNMGLDYNNCQYTSKANLI